MVNNNQDNNKQNNNKKPYKKAQIKTFTHQNAAHGLMWVPPCSTGSGADTCSSGGGASTMMG